MVREMVGTQMMKMKMMGVPTVMMMRAWVMMVTIANLVH